MLLLTFQLKTTAKMQLMFLLPSINYAANCELLCIAGSGRGSGPPGNAGYGGSGGEGGYGAMAADAVSENQKCREGREGREQEGQQTQ